ncbi:MAG: glycosyltransferase [Candidatus Omnitrophota bacterium]|nr:glycosyltransferase [Candidatus Omnitrophota bacterium]
MTVSIIIAVKNWQSNLEECITYCRRLDFPDFEILVLPDEHPGQVYNPQEDSRVRLIPTGAVNPAAKRDAALKTARGQILAFLDDDAYPLKDWLSRAVNNFTDDDVAAVGGPAVTPPQDSLMCQASGMVYSSPLVSSKFVYRYIPGKRREVDDYPSCNFLVRKAVMAQLGGFNTEFWPGEDTKLCLDITKKLGLKIIYDPSVLVYHHRRPLFLGHLKQIANYALHRGYFVKVFPQTSRRPGYFVPTVFLFCVVFGAALSFFVSALRPVYLFGLSLYLVIVFIYGLSKGPRFVLPVSLGIITTHFTYGLFFLKGLLAKKLLNK